MDSNQRASGIPTNPEGVNKSQGGPTTNPGGPGHVPVGEGNTGPATVTPSGTSTSTKQAGPSDQ